MRNKEELDLLGKIFASSLENFHGVDSVRFRAQHHESRACLDSLESSGYIERKNNRYYVRLIALPEMKGDVEAVAKLLLTFEKIFTTLRNSYIENQTTPYSLKSIASHLPMPRKEINVALTYMVGAPIFGGWSNNFDDEDASVVPREEILDFTSFEHVIQRLQEWNTRAHQEAKYPVTVGSTDLRWVAHNASTNSQKIDVAFLGNLLHVDVAKNAMPHFVNGHFREAILNSVIAVFDLIRSRTSLSEDGDRLIGKVFSLDSPYLIFSELDTESGQNEQKGFVQILKGLYQGVRNPNSHTLNHDFDEREAAQHLVMASLLAQRIENAIPGGGGAGPGGGGGRGEGGGGGGR